MAFSSDRVSAPAYLTPTILSTVNEGRHGCGNLLIVSLVVDETMNYGRLDVNH
jgi:hypothetical protein